MDITVYTTITCPFCNMLISYLNSKNIPFRELKVDQDKAAETQMVADSGGFLGVPFTVIKKDDGSKETVIGFDKHRLEQILGS